MDYGLKVLFILDEGVVYCNTCTIYQSLIGKVLIAQTLNSDSYILLSVELSSHEAEEPRGIVGQGWPYLEG